MNQHRAPLFDKILQHRRTLPASFHVPGHKLGQSLDETAHALLVQAMQLDYTEITGLDDLHQPTGVIDEAQRLAAECFGAEQTFFLVNGSTVGNIALILAVCGRGDLLIVQRNVHKSVLHALMLGGVQAVFLPPRTDKTTGIAAGVRPDDVAQALGAYPQAKGVFVTNPNYYGMASDLSSIAKLAHACGVPLLVDEAHGAHFGFHPELPRSALSCGADGVVQSTHKMLTALTMGAMLHAQGPRLNRARLAERLAALQSSSPSYAIMASLDVARQQLAVRGRASLEDGLSAVRRFLDLIRTLPWASSAWEAGSLSAAYDARDPFKIILHDATRTLSGFDLQRELEARGCYIELAEPRHVLLCFSLANRVSDAEKLADALISISEHYQLSNRAVREDPLSEYPPPIVIGISEPISFQMDQREEEIHSSILRLAPKDAAHRRAAEMIVPYPPGIPIVFPGELITPETARYLQQLSDSGARFHHTESPGLCFIRVFQG